MKFYSFLLVFLMTLSASSYAQSSNQTAGLNLGFEQLNESGFPKDWFIWGQGYTIRTDTTEKYQGKNSIMIQSRTETQENQFGSPALGIPVTFKGKEVELSGFLKLRNVDNGHAGLLLRIDGEGKTLQFDNMHQRNIHGSSEWTRYTTRLPLPDDARYIYIAAMNTGTGTVWADDLTLKIDGKDINVVIKENAKTYRAATDHTFDNGSGISISPAGKNAVEDLALLGKVWGFLKYYHPVIASGEVNWDYALFKVLPSYLSSKTAKERNACLLNLVNLAGDINSKATERKERNKDAKILPDLDWLTNKKELGDTLSNKLIQIRSVKRKTEHYYIGLAEGVGNPIFKNENSYASMTFPDDGFRLLSLYRYWNMINYFFPYKHLIGENWNDVLTGFIPTFLNAKNETEYTLAALQLIARIHDTHANIWGGNKVLEMYKGIRSPAFQARFIEEQLVVTGFYSDTLGIKNQIKTGDIISKINGITTAQLIKKYLPLTPASNYPTQLRDIPRNYLLRTNDSTLLFEISDGSKVSELRLPAIDRRKLNFTIDYIPRANLPAYYLIDDKIGYLFPGKYKNTELKEIEKLFAGTKGMIIDMRCYPSDFMPFTFGNYIKEKSSPFVKFTTGSIQDPGLFTFGGAISNGGKGNYTGKVVIIVNELSQSQAEYTTMAFQSSPNVTVIGSTTAGADGNVSAITLPGGISSMISGIGVYYPDGTETQRKGVKIDIPMQPTINGIRAGKDELLEKAKEMILSE